MESENNYGMKRSSAHQGLYGRPVERRSSKKSSSKDRRGMVYPDSFRNTIRAVTPDSDTDKRSPLSDAEYLVGTASDGPSPRANHRSRTVDGGLPRYDGEASDTMNGRVRSLTTNNEERAEGTSKPTGYSWRRFNSFHTNLQPKTPDDQLSLMALSTNNSPSYFSERRRPSRPPGGLTGVNASHPSSMASPMLNADSPKVLQLMKTTSGRMHGVLSFRTSTQTAWTSGYCNINAATGSLVYLPYQAKGEPAQKKTLIPDLRGCRVRTLYDLDFQNTYLTVSTSTSGLGVQLRPHVTETFDSWLAALLCWQPIRPRGVRNKMTKPQPVTIGERRYYDRNRRNSEGTVHKDAAIIKVGKMLLWDKPTASGARPASGCRVSAIRQQRTLKNSWQRVSCTLQENGHFKLFTESDVTLVNSVQLSQLSRGAVQQLNSSVLEDEFCIAIYPQFAAHTNHDPSQTRPLYLTLESRVLFEVWFVLLRAFTVPELYGPETSVEDDDSKRPASTNPTQPASAADMFRIERNLTTKVTEARLFRARDVYAYRSRKQSRSHSQSANTRAAEGDYYTEITLDGEIRAKTAVKYRTANPFWREEFVFNDLPSVQSHVSLLVQTLNAPKDWTLIAHGTYAMSTVQDSSPSQADEVEVCTRDTTYGRVDLRLDDLEPGVETEKWWTIVDDNDQPVGEMLMRARMEETVVLMSHEYEPMSELLHSFTNGLTINMAQIMSSELTQLSQTLLDIYQVSGQAVDWISSLVEDEIDGVHKESTVNRLRYTTRIHSNDARDSGQEREFLVRDLGRTATVEANLLFRGNSLLTKALDLHMRRLGKEYLEETVAEQLRRIDESDPECEVDPSRVHRADDLERNWRTLMAFTTRVWESIAGSASRCPSELRLIFRHIRACAEDRYGDFLRTVTYSSVSGFLFLRFFCPAILNPKLFGLLKDHPRPRAQRTLTLIAKALQGLANMTNFGSKEPWMEPMNRFLLNNRGDFKHFVDSICAIPADRPPPIVTMPYATPIQILGRLPPTSREGFPSLPFLLDHSRSFANLIRIWLEVAPPRLSELDEIDPLILKFHETALRLDKRTKECLGRAEEAERPNGNLADKWEELVDTMERQATFYDDSSKPTTSTTEAAMIGSATTTTATTTTTITSNNNRNSMGYFAARPYLPRRPTDFAPENDDETPPSSSSATWEQSRIPFSMPKWTENRESGTSSKNSSTYSLEYPEVKSGRPSSVSRDSSSKYRLFDFGQRRKAKDRDHSQHAREEARNEFP